MSKGGDIPIVNLGGESLPLAPSLLIPPLYPGSVPPPAGRAGLPLPLLITTVSFIFNTMNQRTVLTIWSTFMACLCTVFTVLINPTFVFKAKEAGRNCKTVLLKLLISCYLISIRVLKLICFNKFPKVG